MRKSVAITILLLIHFSLPGQTFDTEFYPVADHEEEGVLIPETDDYIFNIPVPGAPDPFRNFSRYRFGAVRYRERGLDGRHERVLAGGIELTDNLSSYPDWSLISLLRRSGLAVEYSPAMTAGSSPAAIGRTDSYLLAAAGDELRVALRASDRYSRAGGDIRHGREWGDGWSHRFAATGQFGADGHFRGVRSDEAGGVVAVTKRWKKETSLTIFAAGGISERGLRTAATREAFDLTGDYFYNPTWGEQSGKVRNSRESRTRYLFAAAVLETPLGKDRMLRATVALRHNRNGRSRLAWYDAPSPAPDYYRRMPSFFPDWSAADKIADAWRDGDPTVTHVDWSELYFGNTLAPDGQASYMIEEQVESAEDLHLNVDITRTIEKGLEISYGLRVRRDRSRFYKEAADMLGAEWVPNTDQYVTDPTDTNGEYHAEPPNENDLRNPGRRVRRGDRFGYDYALTRLKPSLYGIVRWTKTSFGFTASGSLTYTRVQRNGFYEKELFPGEASFGRSRALDFTTYSLGASAWWNASSRHSLSLSALASSEAPFARDLFLSPQQNNLIAVSAGEAAPAGLYGAELSWVFAGKDVDLRVTGFVNATDDETQIRQYYDDLSSAFSEMVVRGIDRLGYGVEVGLEARFTRWLSLSAGGSVGEYRYNSEPAATVFEDATGEVISEGIVCHMSGLATGPPQIVAAGELTYSDRRRWRASLSAEWMARRHVEINPLYHSSRVVGINPAPEIMRLFTSQERLPDAFTLGMSLSKGFVLKRGYLRIAGSVRNLLSSRIIHSGYEQMRIMRLGSGITRTLVPFPSKYLYSHPMTWSISVSYSL